MVLKEFKYNGNPINLWVDSQDVDVTNYTGQPLHVGKDNILDADYKYFNGRIKKVEESLNDSYNRTHAISSDDKSTVYAFKCLYNRSTGEYGYRDGTGKFRKFRTNKPVTQVTYLDSIDVHQRVKIAEYTNIYVDTYNDFHLSDYLITIIQLYNGTDATADLQLQIDLTNSAGQKRTITPLDHNFNQICDGGYVLIEPRNFKVDSNTTKAEFYLENLRSVNIISCHRLSLKEGV